MTTLSPRTVSPAGSATDAEARFARLIGMARFSLVEEHVLPGLWPALGFAGVYISAALFGLLVFIPWTLPALLLAATITAIGLSLDSGLGGFTWPRWRDGARRLEEINSLRHRPISTSQDRLISEDPFALELWRVHLMRTLSIDGLRVGWPAPNLSRRDPKYLRYGVLLLVAAALVVAGPKWRQRLVRGFESGTSLAVTLAAWVDPPPILGEQPIYLGPRDTGVITIPAGSTLNVRAYNAAHAPGLSLGGWQSFFHIPPRFAGDNGQYIDAVRVTSDAHPQVRYGGFVVAQWRLHVLPDQIPTIVFDNMPNTVEHLGTRMAFHAKDDYGIAGVKLVLTPHPRKGLPKGTKLVPVSVDMEVLAGKDVAQTTFIDLTNHPYAGLMVDAHLEATDTTTQLGESNSFTFAMPSPPKQNQSSTGQSKQQNQNKSKKKDADPLGRVNIPKGNESARSRAIMQVLRERAGQRDRPQQELDYYQRLLKQF